MVTLSSLRHRRSSHGTLMVEAVVASFLMVFAFAAAASIFDASLRWESSSSNIRKAGLLAERKLGEIRARASKVPSGTTFAAHLDGIVTDAHPEYPDSPGFAFEVTVLDNTHEVVPTSGLTPDNGIHSPCSTFFTRPDNLTSVGRAAPPYAVDPGGDFQRNSTYETFPYSRAMPNSYRLLQVTVSYGGGEEQKVRLLSLLGDPILPPRKPVDNLNVTLTVQRLSGAVNLSGPGDFAEYGIVVTTDNGSIVDDVSALWSIHPLSSGIVDIFPLDATDTRVRISRTNLSRNGTTLRLFPQVRYESIEARATSDVIGL